MKAAGFLSNCQNKEFENQFNLQIDIFDPQGIVVPLNHAVMEEPAVENEEVAVQAQPQQSDFGCQMIVEVLDVECQYSEPAKQEMQPNFIEF